MLHLLLEVEQPNMAAQLLQSFGLFIPMIVIFYFLLIRPQRKREKAEQNMRSSLEVGDEIVTKGGIIGRVVSIRDDNLMIETGSDRNKIRIVRDAVATNRTVHDTTPNAKD